MMSFFSTTKPLHIAIVGGGPAGLALANILQRLRNTRSAKGQPTPWHTTVYEADASASMRRLGGSLDLERDSGLVAITNAGLLNQFMELARPEDQETRCVNKRGDILLRTAAESQTIDSPRYSPEIDRADLCRLLTDSLDKGMIAWGHKLESITQDKTDAYELHFTNGTSAHADLVVGADGAWSRVRPLVSSERPSYTGATFLDCTEK
ncbi:hypothetical protein P43SY_011388 [Pythium insidiosum]|uniref:FAD-binding domain-containing protein n=1 Tax=Pythium insidiosum TaxID=114742 RepID=A0AAD5L560_PYTIN|nr:hypothetical protein P43SY_011388 [Pythium insidiosum]